MDLDPLQLNGALKHGVATGGRITVLTGAGISAESGIPTFRGPEGYWTVGSVHYQPEQISNYAMFLREPGEVWKWFLYRRGVCRAADPNLGHRALAEMEGLLADHYCLITQNVDGLHLRAGSGLQRTLQIHGNLNYMRCCRACREEALLIPDTLPAKARGEEMTATEWDLLICPHCGSRTRPHVLLFDECYDETHYRFETALRVAAETSLLIVVGTEGATALPNHIVESVLSNGGTIIDVNVRRNRFSESAEASPQGLFIEGAASAVLTQVLTQLTDVLA